MTPPPVNPSHDRALLFAVLAHQMSFIDRAALVETLNAWSLDKSRNIADLLVERGHLTRDARALLEGLANHQETVHGDAAGGLAALSASGSTFEEIATRIPDPDLQASIQHLATRAPEPASHRTRPPLPDDPHATRPSDPELTDVPFGVGGATVGTTSASGIRYRTLKFHAKGGLGAVFVALDHELNREVALKQIQDKHADDPGSRSRFVKEAEITGQLEHPGIVPVYGLGSYADGRPFYAMRFIKGDSLKEAIRLYHEHPDPDPSRRAVELRALLRRFLDVCNAIEYAHARGVLHRDLKPGNVMVGKYGETLVVDWGLARLLRPPGEAASHPDGETTVRPSSGSSSETGQGDMVGTVGYMSPEQAAGRLDELGPASDVYSLGAILYALLTNRSTISGVEKAEVLRRVQTGDFPPPRQLGPNLPRALDAICLKALAISPHERYPTARTLAADLDRWLADEPVLARREPLAEQTRRWMRRHRTAMTSTAAAVLVAMVALVALQALQARTNRDLRAANKRESARFDLAMSAIKTFHTGVSEDFLLKQESFKELKNKLLREASEFYRKLEEELKGQTDDRSRNALGEAAFQLGKLTYNIGSMDQARASFQMARAIWQGLANANPADSRYQSDLARSLHSIGNVQNAIGLPKEARDTYEEARTMRRRLVDAHPSVAEFQDDLADSHFNLGHLLHSTGRSSEALEAHEEARALRQKLADAHPSVDEFQRALANSCTAIANIQGDIGQTDQALRSHEAARAILKKLVAKDPTMDEFQMGLGYSHNGIGLLQSKTGQPREAIQSYEAARAIWQKLADANPAVNQFQNHLAYSDNNLGLVRQDMRQPKNALQAYEQARVIRQKLVDANPDVTEFQNNLAYCLHNIGLVQREARQPKESMQSLEAARAIWQRLTDTNPTVTEFQRELARSHNDIGVLHWSSGRLQEALQLFEQARGMRKKLADANPSLTQFQSELGGTLNNLALIDIRGEQWGRARTRLLEAIRYQSVAYKENPRNPSYRQFLRNHFSNLATTNQALGNPAEAAEAAREMMRLSPGEAVRLYDGACYLARSMPRVTGNELTRLGEEAMGALRAAVAAGWNDAAHTTRDTDLIPLRGRADFQGLLRSLQDRVFPADPFALGK